MRYVCVSTVSGLRVKRDWMLCSLCYPSRLLLATIMEKSTYILKIYYITV